MDFKKSSIFCACLAPIFLVGCGGSDSASVGTQKYDGITTAVVLDAENQAQIATNSIQITPSLIQASIYNDIPSPFDHLDGQNNCNGSVQPDGTNHIYSDFCINDAIANGSVNVSLNSSSSVASYSNFTLTFDTLDYILSGNIQAQRLSANRLSNVFDFTVLNNDQEFSFYISEECTVTTNSAGETSGISGCDVSIIDNEHITPYKMDDFTSDLDNSLNRDISGELFLSEYGYLDYRADNLMLCDEGDFEFESGKIILTDDLGSQITIINNGCDADTDIGPQISFIPAVTEE